MTGVNMDGLPPLVQGVSIRTSAFIPWVEEWVEDPGAPLLLEKALRTAGAECYQYPNHQTTQLWGNSRWCIPNALAALA